MYKCLDGHFSTLSIVLSVLYVIALPLSETVPLNTISNDSAVVYQVFSCCDNITTSSNGYFVNVSLNDAGTLALTQPSRLMIRAKSSDSKTYLLYGKLSYHYSTGDEVCVEFYHLKYYTQSQWPGNCTWRFASIDRCSDSESTTIRQDSTTVVQTTKTTYSYSAANMFLRTSVKSPTSGTLTEKSTASTSTPVPNTSPITTDTMLTAKTLSSATLTRHSNNTLTNTTVRSSTLSYDSTCMCSCPCSSSPDAVEIEKSVQEIIANLTVDKSSTSQTKRKLTSASDMRTSSAGLGSVGSAVIAILVGVVVISDAKTFFVTLCRLNRK